MPINAFARLLVDRYGMPVSLANGYANAFRVADSAEKRARIIETLNLSHAATALALYGEHVARSSDSERNTNG